MKFASLGSGSDGNALLIAVEESDGSRSVVMLDCGFGLRETERRLARIGLMPQDLSAIIVTHEHQDHIGGVFKFSRRHSTPVWLTRGTYQAAKNDCGVADIHFCRDGEAFGIGGLSLTPYTVPHDAREPVQYVATDGRFRLGVLTDAGQCTPHLIQALDGCDALIVECNHDCQMLADSNYPASLKERIGGRYGHLSNDTVAEILSALDRSRLKIIIGAHLSKQNNTAELAEATLRRIVDPSVTEIVIACQEQGFGWVELGV